MRHPGGRAASGPGGGGLAVAALGLIAVVTAGWWALALWPAPSDAPAWLLRTREVCFGRTETGLPDAGGWILLVGQPLGMVGLLLAGWRRSLVRGLARAWRGGTGRGVLAGAVALGVVGLFAAGARVRSATATPAWARPAAAALPSPDYPTLDRPAPAHALVDQHGERVGLEAFRGRPVIVTFAFGHCETVCPVVVRTAAAARERLAEALDPALVVLTLDPWRDTPSRLEHLAGQWELPPGARVLGGEVAEVEAALDAWNVARSRDTTTGDVVHPALIYLVDADGVVRYATTGGVDAVVELAHRMAGGRPAA